MELACTDSDGDGTIDVSTVFNWEKNSNAAFGLPNSLTAVRATTPKCRPATVYNLAGLTYPILITGPSGGAGSGSSAVSVAENQTGVFDFDADEAGTWSLSGTDAGLFEIDSDGVVTFVGAPDFEAPGDSGGNNVYDIVVSIEDGSGNVSTQTVAVTVTDVAEDVTAPVVTGGQTFSYGENQGAAFEIGTVAATDGVGVTGYAIVSGNGSGFFAIDSAGKFQ